MCRRADLPGLLGYPLSHRMALGGCPDNTAISGFAHHPPSLSSWSACHQTRTLLEILHLGSGVDEAGRGWGGRFLQSHRSGTENL